MKELQPTQRQISWKKVAITVGFATLILMAGTIAYDNWRVSQGWCARFYPDGTKKIMYGDDCWK
ncbi:hypothetical protein [Nostoc sp. NMS4]|uniref:hypothetical protein n=1 Tax=Nostoc sp. NMS4 TaxID=2815390 RepID=UPI0025CF9C0D|nr:hypothetical protein [Nostoc sp. NMS4]MBN3925624.1 hypothetical protein [Nostoc sp. NMS4]